MNHGGLRRGHASGIALLMAAGLVAGCGGGTAATNAPPPAASPTAAPATPAATVAASTAASENPYAIVDQFEGTYAGSWTNTTYGSTGPAQVQVRVQHTAGTIEIRMTLGGNVFGQPAPAPETITATFTPGQPLSFTSTTFGPTTLAFDVSTMTVTFTSNDVPSARVKTFVATAKITDPKTIQLTYDVTFRDSTPAAHGTATLTR